MSNSKVYSDLSGYQIQPDSCFSNSNFISSWLSSIKAGRFVTSSQETMESVSFADWLDYFRGEISNGKKSTPLLNKLFTTLIDTIKTLPQNSISSPKEALTYLKTNSDNIIQSLCKQNSDQTKLVKQYCDLIKERLGMLVLLQRKISNHTCETVAESPIFKEADQYCTTNNKKAQLRQSAQLKEIICHAILTGDLRLTDLAEYNGKQWWKRVGWWIISCKFGYLFGGKTFSLAQAMQAIVKSREDTIKKLEKDLRKTKKLADAAICEATNITAPATTADNNAINAAKYPEANPIEKNESQTYKDLLEKQHILELQINKANDILNQAQQQLDELKNKENPYTNFLGDTALFLLKIVLIAGKVLSSAALCFVFLHPLGWFVMGLAIAIACGNGLACIITRGQSMWKGMGFNPEKQQMRLDGDEKNWFLKGFAPGENKTTGYWLFDAAAKWFAIMASGAAGLTAFYGISAALSYFILHTLALAGVLAIASNPILLALVFVLSIAAMASFYYYQANGIKDSIIKLFQYCKKTWNTGCWKRRTALCLVFPLVLVVYGILTYFTVKSGLHNLLGLTGGPDWVGYMLLALSASTTILINTFSQVGKFISEFILEGPVNFFRNFWNEIADRWNEPNQTFGRKFWFVVGMIAALGVMAFDLIAYCVAGGWTSGDNIAGSEFGLHQYFGIVTSLQAIAATVLSVISLAFNWIPFFREDMVRIMPTARPAESENNNGIATPIVNNENNLEQEGAATTANTQQIIPNGSVLSVKVGHPIPFAYYHKNSFFHDDLDLLNNKPKLKALQRFGTSQNMFKAPEKHLSQDDLILSIKRKEASITYDKIDDIIERTKSNLKSSPSPTK